MRTVCEMLATPGKYIYRMENRMADGIDNKIDSLQKTAGKIQNVYTKLIGPVISIIVPAILIGMLAYLALGGAFNIGDLADQNNVVRIPLVLLVGALPVGGLMELVGVTAGGAIIGAVLVLWLIGGIVTLIKRLKSLKSAE
jgi:hypothetical protein